MKNIETLTDLKFEELVEINGGGLVEDIGYVAHAIEDGACRAWSWIKSTASSAYNEVASWF